MILLLFVSGNFIDGEVLIQNPDVNHMKLLLQQTHHNRRAWIDSKPSTQLHLATVVDD